MLATDFAMQPSKPEENGKNFPSIENQRPATKATLPARLSIKIEGQIKSFPDKRSLKDTAPPNQLCKRCYRDCFKEKKEKRNTEEHR